MQRDIALNVTLPDRRPSIRREPRHDRLAVSKRIRLQVIRGHRKLLRVQRRNPVPRCDSVVRRLQRFEKNRLGWQSQRQEKNGHEHTSTSLRGQGTLSLDNQIGRVSVVAARLYLRAEVESM